MEQVRGTIVGFVTLAVVVTLALALPHHREAHARRTTRIVSTRPADRLADRRIVLVTSHHRAHLVAVWTFATVANRNRMLARAEAARERASTRTTSRALSSSSSSSPPATGSTGVNWDRIAQCETGSNWQHVGSNSQGSFYGGLGMSPGAWADHGGLQYAPEANGATREQQIAVAENEYRDSGLSGWGCGSYG